MDYDALILAGGRSSRLGGIPKSGLLHDGVALLDRTVAAARGAGKIAVVGPQVQLPPGVVAAREDPPFSGPAAAIAAGLAALTRVRLPAPFTLVLACDMPLVDRAVPALLAACESEANVRGPDFGGVAAVSPDGRRQPLAGIYCTARLHANAEDMAREGMLANGSVRALLANLDVVAVPVPAGSTDDVDTWVDAEVLGVVRSAGHDGPGRNRDEATWRQT